MFPSQGDCFCTGVEADEKKGRGPDARLLHFTSAETRAASLDLINDIQVPAGFPFQVRFTACLLTEMSGKGKRKEVKRLFIPC